MVCNRGNRHPAAQRIQPQPDLTIDENEDKRDSQATEMVRVTSNSVTSSSHEATANDITVDIES